MAVPVGNGERAIGRGGSEQKRLSLWAAVRAHKGCRVCGLGYPISPACLATSLEPVPSDACPRCAQRCLAGRCVSLGCRHGWFHLNRTHAVLGYKQGDVQRLVLAAKDAAERSAVILLGRLLAGYLLAEHVTRAYDWLLPVPFHHDTLRGRPVHPLTAIYLDALPALRPAIRCDDLEPPFLVQTRVVASLRGQSETARWRAVRGTFALGCATRMLRGARVLLLDDVMTTGATLSECARVLMEEAAATAVAAVVLVRQPWRTHAVAGPHGCARGGQPSWTRRASADL